MPARGVAAERTPPKPPKAFLFQKRKEKNRRTDPQEFQKTAPLLLTHVAYMAAHRPEPSATPNAQLYGIGFNCLHAGQQCLQPAVHKLVGHYTDYGLQ
jgi:hypothetical protein